MKKRLKILLISFAFLCINGASIHAIAATDNDAQETYIIGTQLGAINQKKVSIKQWKEQNKQYYQVYQQGLSHGMYKISYEQWLKENNFGQGPISSTNIVTKKRLTSLGEENSMKLTPGDIIITNNASSYGILGHAAICDRKDHVLDMPGYPAEPYNDNNRELTAQQWFDDYKKSGTFIDVYHASNPTDEKVAETVGDYALKHYWNPDVSFMKQIHIPYRINLYLYDTTSMYCSKLVYDAFWFTKGNDSLIKKSLLYEFPYSLASDIKYPLVETEYIN